MTRLLLLALAVSPLSLLAAAGPALASAPTGRDYGCHVSTQARAGMLGQGMNPGQHHQGFSGWDGTMPC